MGKPGPTLDRDQENKKFKKLDEEWRNSRLSEKDDQKLLDEITQCAMNHIALDLAQKVDGDILALQEQLTTARAVYKDGKKAALLKIEFLMETLRGRGRAIPGIEDFMSAAAKRAAGMDSDLAATSAHHEKEAASSHAAVDAIVKDAGRRFAEGMADAVGPGGSVTISTPAGRSVTIKGRPKGPARETEGESDSD